MAGASEGVYESYADSRQTTISDAVAKETLVACTVTKDDKRPCNKGVPEGNGARLPANLSMEEGTKSRLGHFSLPYWRVSFSRLDIP